MTLTGQLPPHDLDAEATLLAAVLLDAGALDRALPVLKPEHFFADANGRIFEAAADLASRRIAVDLTSVASALKDRGRLAQVGGAAYIAQVAEQSPAIRNVEQHAVHIREKWRLRQVIATCQRIAAGGYDALPGTVAEYIDAAEAALFAIASARDDVSSVTLHDSLVGVFKRVQDEAAGLVQPSGFATGLADLDGILGPLKLGQLSIVGALSSVGKSAFAMGCAVWNAESRLDAVLVFSLEMTHEDLSTRVLFSEAGVSTSKLSNPAKYITRDDWTRLAGTVTRVALPNLTIDDRTDLSIADMRAKVRRVVAETRVRDTRPEPERLARPSNVLVVADYLQLMNGRDGVEKNANREREIASIAKGLKDLAKECGVHVMALAQLNDDGSKRRDKDKAPRLSDLRESKAIAQCADKVLLIHNPNAIARSQAYRNGSTSAVSTLPAETVDLIVAKNRGSLTGTTRALFHPSFTQFSSYDLGEGV